MHECINICNGSLYVADIRSSSSFADTDEDAHSGNEDAYDTPQKYAKKLGKRSGPRWSLPTGLMRTQRASLATTERRLHFRYSVSL